MTPIASPRSLVLKFEELLGLLTVKRAYTPSNLSTLILFYEKDVGFRSIHEDVNTTLDGNILHKLKNSRTWKCIDVCNSCFIR